MRRLPFTLVTIVLLVAAPVLAKSKTDQALPPYILRARTVAVIVDPGAGIDLEDPRANQVAQKDVETALISWGRFKPVIDTSEADLIIVVRRGHKSLATTTISDPRQNDRAAVINPTENGVNIGAQHGRLPNLGGNTPDGVVPQSPQPQTEVASSEDSFTIFDGGVKRPLDGVPGWRYTAKDGLRPHSVPAVEEFRKAVAAGDRAAAAANKP